MPGAGVEPAPSCEERILSPFERVLPDLTKRDEPIFTGLAAVKVMLRPGYVPRQNVVILASSVSEEIVLG